jgi:hypothetical protein
MGQWAHPSDEKRLMFGKYYSRKSRLFPLSSRPKRTRISYFALLATTTCAVFLKENRMILINATDLYGKSGGAQWRDLCVDAPAWKCLNKFFFDVISKVRAQCLQ